MFCLRDRFVCGWTCMRYTKDMHFWTEIEMMDAPTMSNCRRVVEGLPGQTKHEVEEDQDTGRGTPY